MTATARQARSERRRRARAAKPRVYLLHGFTITRDDSRGDAARWVVTRENGELGAFATRGAADRAINAFYEVPARNRAERRQRAREA